MAEETIDPTPGRIERNGTNIGEDSSGDLGSLNNGDITHVLHRRASSGSYHVEDQLRNSSNSDSAKGSRKKVPHYLRASTGSCHDLCKYGRKHEFEEKARKPIRKRIVKTSPNDYFVEIKVSGGQKKENLAKDTNNLSPALNPSPVIRSYSPRPKISSDVKTYSPSRNGLSGDKTRLPKQKASPTEKSPSPDPPEIIKMEIPLPSRKVEDPSKKSSSTDNKLSTAEEKVDKLSRKHSLPLKLKPVKYKQSPSSDISDGIRGSTRRNSDGKTGGKMVGSMASAKKTLASPAVTPSPKFPMTKKAPIRTKKAGNLKLSSPLKDQNRMRKVKDETSSNGKVTEKTLHAIEMETKKTGSVSNSDDNATASLASPSSPKSSSPQKPSLEEDGEEIERIGNEAAESVSFKKESKGHKVKTAKGNHNKTLKKTRALVSGDKYRSPAKIKPRSGKSVDPLSNSPEKLCLEEKGEEIERSGNETKESICAKKESEEVSKAKPAKENQNKTLMKKSRAVVAEDKYRSPAKIKLRSGKVVVNPQSDPPVKLKFRSGKSMEPQLDNTPPKRLRFRKAIVLGSGDGKGDLKRRNFKKVVSNYDGTGAVSSSEKVILKHHGVQGRKDAQVLLNNVIEETASKLVESKKSKVKALVGAFETVISLQETKPAPPPQPSGE